MSYRNNRPAQRSPEPAPATPVNPQPVAHHAPAKHAKRAPKHTGRRSKVLAAVIGIVIIVIVSALAWMFLGKANAGTGIDASKYQAVFFTNGQVYFGKLSVKNSEYMSLKNVYYLQTKSTAQSKTSPQTTSKQDSSDVELIKLGNEIHGPDDEMIISRDQVLFFENLKPAGTVSQTISNFQKKNK